MEGRLVLNLGNGGLAGEVFAGWKKKENRFTESVTGIILHLGPAPLRPTPLRPKPHLGPASLRPTPLRPSPI